jgi:hypothetical protein
MYGSTPIEDIPAYNVITRALTEWTTELSHGVMTSGSIAQGIGGIAPGYSGQLSVAGDAGIGSSNPILVNVRLAYIQGISLSFTAVDAGVNSGLGVVPNGATAITALGAMTRIAGQDPIRRYQVQLNLGLFNQQKLIPTKFMASQLAIEITLESAAGCMIYYTRGTPTTTAPTYQVLNVNLIPEILEFDASYDESFLQGLRSGGVPIKFSTYNNFRFSTQGATTQNLQIQERSRSVKAIFCLQRRDPVQIGTDSGASFFNTDVVTINGASTFQEYQFRIGGRYFLNSIDIFLLNQFNVQL